MFYGAIKTISHYYQIDGSRKADEKFRRNVFKIFLSVFTDNCLNRVLLSSTPRQFNTKGPLLFSPQNPSVQHQKPFSSTPKTPQFHTKNPLVPHQKKVTQKNLQKTRRHQEFMQLTKNFFMHMIYFCG